jgi:AcrR family transcriptional regulator
VQQLESREGGAPRGREAVVDALIDSAAELFATRGIEGASVREVAAAAGVNHALVFRHFGSKQRLVRVVLDRQLDELVAEFRRAGLDPEALAAVGERVANDERLWKLLTRAVLDGEIDFVTERAFPEIETVVATLARAAEAGRLPAEVDARTLLLIVLSGALGWALLEPVLVPTVGTPGETPGRRRELARAAFGELLGIAPEGAAWPTDAEAERARVPREAPGTAFGTAPPPRGRREPAGTGPPRGRIQVCDALISAAMELFALRGPAAVSVREVAAAAGVNHALVFRHFGSKDALVQAVFERAAEELAQQMVGVPDYQGFAAFTEALAESETHWRLIARAILDGELETLASHPYHFVNAMVWAAARGQEAGMVETRVHPRLIVSMVCAMGLGWLIFHPVLNPLLGLPPVEPVEQRHVLRTAVAKLLGWHGAPPLAGRSH